MQYYHGSSENIPDGILPEGTCVTDMIQNALIFADRDCRRKGRDMSKAIIYPLMLDPAEDTKEIIITGVRDTVLTHDTKADSPIQVNEEVRAKCRAANLAEQEGMF